jgi:hypothetical protein
MRLTDEVTGERYLVFAITLQGGHRIKDRYFTPGEVTGGDPALAIPFPEIVWYDPDPEAIPDVTPSLQVLAGEVDENLDMLPGAHVILHLHVADVPLLRSEKDGDKVIGTISVGDIEFTMPE